MKVLTEKLTCFMKLQERIVQKDGQGGTKVSGWKEVMRVWGEIRNPKIYVTEVMGGVAGIVESPIYIRPVKGIKVGQRLEVVSDGTYYTIINIWTNHRDEMVLTCRKEEFDGADNTGDQ